MKPDFEMDRKRWKRDSASQHAPSQDHRRPYRDAPRRVLHRRR